MGKFKELEIEKQDQALQTKEVANLNREIQELRDEWEILDKHGSNTVRQNQITARIQTLQDKITDLTKGVL